MSMLESIFFRYLLLFFALSGAAPSLADQFGAELIILNSHVQSQRDAPVEYYEHKLDAEGQHIFTPGVELYYDRDLDTPFLQSSKLRYVGGLLNDSADHLFGYIGIMGHYPLYKGGTSSVELHIGPGFIFRESWRDIPNYNPDNPFQESDHFMRGYEYRLLPIGEIDVVFQLSDKKEIVWSIVPGVPYIIMQSVGIRWALE